MHILYITHSTDLAGANRSMLQMIDELKTNHGVKPFVIFPHIYATEKNNIKSELISKDIPFIEHRLVTFKRRSGVNFIHAIYFIVNQFINVVHLLYLLRHKRFDIVHSNTSVCDMGVYLAMFWGVPHVMHLREFGKEDFNMASCLGKNYEKWIYSKNTKAIAISKVIKKHFSNIINPNKIELIYNGIASKYALSESLHNSAITNICIVGRVEPNKNQLEALKAINVMKEMGEINFHLYIIGKEDAYYKALLKEYVKNYHLDSFVTFMGVRYDVNDLLDSMDIGLMLSTNEAFGRVTIEYQFHNLVVVATSQGANNELIENNRTGYLYNLGDTNVLARIMYELIKDKQRLTKVARRGKENALTNFSSEKNSNSVYHLYKNIVYYG